MSAVALYIIAAVLGLSFTLPGFAIMYSYHWRAISLIAPYFTAWQDEGC